jgi:hypothetical protein
MDYWEESMAPNTTMCIGNKRDTNIKILVKSNAEYTSEIVNIFKSGSELIAVTENSIYIVRNSLAVRKIA